MKIKDDKIQGEVYVTGASLFDAVKAVDAGFIHADEDLAESAASWPEKVYRVEVTIYEA